MECVATAFVHINSADIPIDINEEKYIKFIIIFPRRHGVTEALNKKAGILRDARLLGFLKNTDASNTEKLMYMIEKYIAKFANGEPQSDDFTLLFFIYCK